MTGIPHESDVFAATKDASRCPVVDERLGRCGYVAGHDRQHGVAVLESGELALHLWSGAEVRRVEPGPWGMATVRLPWAAGYYFPEPTSRGPLP